MGKNKGKGSAAQGGGGSQLNAPSGEHLEELKASLTRYNDSFSTLLGLVPAKFYLPEEDALDRRGSQQDPADGKKLSKKQRKQLQQEQQAADGELALAKRLAKKAKYDPNTPRTVIEIQQARAAAAAADSDSEEEVGIALKGFTSAPVTAVGPEANEDEEDSPNDSDFEDDAADDEDIAASTAVKAKTGKSTAGVSSAAAGLADVVLDPQALAGATGESSREALLAERKKRGEVRDKRRERMRERKRKERDGAAAPGDVPASVSLKRKREEEAAAFRASGMASGTSDKVGKAAKMSDVKKALKKEGRRQPPVQMADSGDDDDTRMDTSAARAGPSVPATKASAPATSSSALATSSGPANPASIAFSSLDFTPSSAVGGPDAPKLTKKQREALGKNTRMGVTSHDPAVALNALKGREEFLSKLTPQARERAEEKDKWERMAMRAEGTKVYDEEAKLKKMVKRREKAKDKSRKDWADRKETLENTQAAQQKKRQENINARLQQRKDKKSGTKPKTKSIGKQNPKKAKGRPGFEGKGGGSKK